MTSKARKFVFSLALSGAFAMPGFAADSTDRGANPESEVTPPVPIHVIKPGVEPYQVGKVVTLRITVDESGAPVDVRTASFRTADPLLAARIIRAVQAWQFEPARDNSGQPVSVTVEMPIMVNQIGVS